MKTLLLVASFTSSFCLIQAAFGDQLTPSKLDPQYAEAREKAFTPWGDEEQTGATWRKLSPTHIPVYGEHRADGWKRGIYIPNPGTGYWSLDGLSEQSFWSTEREKLKIGDELVSAGKCENDDGVTKYWALWAPRTKAYLIKEKMRALGITPASVDIDESYVPFSGAVVFHRSDGHIIYDLTIRNRKVNGVQRMDDGRKPIAKVVGGWFDFETGKLDVLIQGSESVDLKWRTQAQQFHVNLSSKTVTLEHMLYGDGLTLENSSIMTEHVLDVLDKVEHLVKPDHAK